MSDLPTLISNHAPVLEQLNLLVRDIERGKWDAGVTVMVSNGNIDVRGLGFVDQPAAASALLFAAFKSLPPASQSDMLERLNVMMGRSVQIAKEAELWRVTPPQPHSGTRRQP